MVGMEIFPVASDEIPDQDVAYGNMHFNIRMCKLCGAGVFLTGMGLHIDFHNTLLTIKDM